MQSWLLTLAALLCSLVFLRLARGSEFPAGPGEIKSGVRVFTSHGVVLEVQSITGRVLIRHEAISNYMDAMTMPFKAGSQADLAGLQRGDEINFQLHVTQNESWVDHIAKVGTVVLEEKKAAEVQTNGTPSAGRENPLLEYKFTNELGQAVSLNEFRGQALAITFFYTRCPLPEFCSRLSKNFQEASQKLKATPGAPANWHLLSISIDPEFDSPEMLRAYGGSYAYDPAHWSFLTGSADKIAELARQSGVEYKNEDGTINHNFRTLIIDAAGRLQMVFPTSGNLSDAIAGEIVKAAAATNQAVAQIKTP